MNPTPHSATRYWPLVLAATAMLMITMGVRQSMGLFVAPIHQDTGIGIAAISFALAIGQFTWGAVQPVFGAIADKRGTTGVLVLGAVLLALGLALTPHLTSPWGLMFTLGLLTAAGAGAGSFSILIGATAQQLAPEKRSFAAGFINAGGSLGQFVFAPLVQAVIALAGWASAMYTLAVASLLAIPLAFPLRRKKAADAAAPPATTTSTVAPRRVATSSAAASAASDPAEPSSPTTTDTGRHAPSSRAGRASRTEQRASWRSWVEVSPITIPSSLLLCRPPSASAVAPS